MFNVLQVTQESAYFTEIEIARFRQLDLAGGSLQQSHTEALLKRLDAATHGGGRGAQPFGSRTEAFLFDYRQEHLEFFHRVFLVC